MAPNPKPDPLSLPACKAISEKTEQKSFQEMADAGVVLELDSEPH